MITIIQPTTNQLIEQRNKLLQEFLRPTNIPFTIESEYPIVLNPNNPQYSYCLLYDNQLAAHLNLWPRIFINEQTHHNYQLGLIGNVVTALKFRGKKLMSYLFKNIEHLSESKNIQALLLWSDLSLFYQKLGFKSVGEEYLIQFNYNNLNQYCNNPTRFKLLHPQDITKSIYQNLIKIRYPTMYSIQRTYQEFLTLLQIPLVGLFVSTTTNNKINNFFIIGKGYDMIYTIHEWGFSTPDAAIIALTTACEFFKISNIFLLCPKSINDEYKNYFKKLCTDWKTQPMAWMKILDKNKENEIKESIENGFIWGLDSI